MQQLILASSSPRRRELLAQIIPDFLIVPSDFAEVQAGASAAETALAFAEGKARDVFSRYPQNIVLGADTVVALDGRQLGKPVSKEDAARMLRALSGRTHAVYTGVCLLSCDYFLHDVVKTLVTFRVLTEETIRSYIRSGSPMDKAGAYGIQDGMLVSSYSGSYTNVVGLPVERVRSMLKEVHLC